MAYRHIGFILLLWIFNVGSDHREETYGGYPFWEDWKPSRYSLDIWMKIEEKSFFGEVRITGTVLKDTDKLGFHSKVNIKDGFYSIKDTNTKLNLNLASENVTCGVIIFVLDQIIRKDVEFILTLKYSGNMNELKGLYMSFYEFNNEKRKVISTEFQPMGARLVFPCIDIPSYKAVFEIKLGRPQSMKALSNMPIRNTSAPDPKIKGQVWDTFYPTPKMSTYNVAFVIFDDLASAEFPKNNTIWYPEAIKENILLPSEIMAVLLEAMENYTGIDYNLPKMDLVLVPNKIVAAMESWGLITWSHRFLFLKREMSTFDDELKFVLIMAHEIAHQWFGNLVTCRYWCYLWLNEGITSYLMNLIVDQLFPESKAMELFVSINMESVISDDFYMPFSLVEKKFCQDRILKYTTSFNTYLKGSAITNMVANIIMNNGSFRQGLQTYLMENQFDSVTEKELWGALQTKMGNNSIPDGESLESLMYGWTHNYGFPLLTVYRHKNGSLTVKQKPFDMPRKNGDVESHWWIPVTYTTSKERNFENVHLKEWLRPTNEAQPVTPILADDEWIILNLQKIGYYKVNYDQRTWELIATDLLNDNLVKIHPLNRAQIINDAIFLANSKLLSYSTFLNLSRYLKNEAYYAPLYNGLSFILELVHYSMGTPVHDTLKTYYKYIVSNVYKRVTSRGFRVTNLINYALKMMIVKYGCSLDFQHCKNQTKQLLDDIMNNRIDENQLNSELRSTFWCTASKIGDEKVFNYIKQKYIKEKNWKLKEDYFNALFCVKNKELFQRLLKDILYKADYLKQETLTSLLSNLVSSDSSCYTIDYYSENFDSLNLHFGNESVKEQLKKIISSRTGKKECKDKLAELLEQKSINVVILERFWDRKYVAEITSWFKNAAIDFEIKEDNTDKSDTNIFIDNNTNFFKVIK
ncbi:aminopeptidase Ey-like [Cimex lectularius]|uniref:Aminopeptidase n=1 Tax=Cimex lectularius TaxID=79782 RepID=A0A8I6SRB6_CIMLE|nr:aminopeptidase Ey-like [Cimex lectularius]